MTRPETVLVQPHPYKNLGGTPLSTPATAPCAPPAGELLTIEQAAAHINMSTRYVRRLIAERRIVTYRFGRAVRLHSADLNAYIVASRIEPITRESIWRDFKGVA